MENISTDIVHLGDRINIVNRKGSRYIILYVDQLTGYIVGYHAKKKTEVINTLQTLEKHHISFYGHKLKYLQADSDTMYLDQELRNWCIDKGVKNIYSAPYHHQGNGSVERFVQTLMDMTRTMMIAAKAELHEADHYIDTAIYILNRTPNSKLKDKTPYEAVRGMKPDISFIVPAGSIGYVLEYNEEHKDKDKCKLAPKAKECKLMGYSEEYKNAYIVKLLGRKQELIRRDVLFIEEDVNNPYTYENLQVIKEEVKRINNDNKLSKQRDVNNKEEHPLITAVRNKVIVTRSRRNINDIVEDKDKTNIIDDFDYDQFKEDNWYSNITINEKNDPNMIQTESDLIDNEQNEQINALQSFHMQVKDKTLYLKIRVITSINGVSIYLMKTI